MELRSEKKILDGAFKKNSMITINMYVYVNMIMNIKYTQCVIKKSKYVNNKKLINYFTLQKNDKMIREMEN